MFFNKSKEKVLVMLDVDSIKELATEKVNSINITSEGETHHYKIVKGEVILSNEQMKEILKNLQFFIKLFY